MKNQLNTVEQRLLSLTVPAQTESYTPIPHSLIIQRTHEELDKRDLKIVSKDYRIQGGGQGIVGIYGIKANDSEMGMMIGFRNSYDKSMAAGFACGASVFICENGMVSGDLRIIRKHTGVADIDINFKLEESFSYLESEFNKLKEDRELLKEREMHKKVVAELLGRMFIEEEIINSTQLNVIKRELEIPTFEYTKDKNTMWDFYNYVTFALKNSQPLNAFRQYSNCHKFILKNV